jgi:hypothetical protein
MAAQANHPVSGFPLISASMLPTANTQGLQLGQHAVLPLPQVYVLK